MKLMDMYRSFADAIERNTKAGEYCLLTLWMKYKLVSIVESIGTT